MKELFKDFDMDEAFRKFEMYCNFGDMIEEEHYTITKESCKTWKESVKPQNKIAPKPYTQICFQLRNKQK